MSRPSGRPESRSVFQRGKVPLERALSKRGIASRTQARQWIEAGRVKVNGVLRKDPGFMVTPELARFEVDGKMAESSGFRAVMLHKPRGLVTTRQDEKGRATVFSLLAPEEGVYLHAVGRLDQATSGLLILTNDTRFSAWLTDPDNGVERTYLVTVRGLVGQEALTRLASGFEDGGEHLRADRVELRKASGRESHLTVILTEGRNREIRRMFAALGHEVTRLKRIAFGGLELGGLAVGKSRELTDEELKGLKR